MPESMGSAKRTSIDAGGRPEVPQTVTRTEPSAAAGAAGFPTRPGVPLYESPSCAANAAPL
jgi:hypothetical protein